MNDRNLIYSFAASSRQHSAQAKVVAKKKYNFALPRPHLARKRKISLVSINALVFVSKGFSRELKNLDLSYLGMQDILQYTYSIVAS